MKCPYCNNEEIKVIDSRSTDKLTIRRRRVCTNCNRRFTTYEKIELDPLIVVKKDLDREQYNKEKIKNSIITVCHKRPVTEFDIDKITEIINNEIIKSEKTEIESSDIKKIVAEKLIELDEVAYKRYMSAYSRNPT